MAGRSSNKKRRNSQKDIDLKQYQETQSRIRWKDGEKGELARLVRNYNQKRRRAIKRGIPEKALPPVVWGKDLRDNVITTRRDLNFEIEALKRFMKSDVSSYKQYQHIQLTDAMLKEIEYLRKKGDTAVLKERQRLERLRVTSFGESITYKEDGKTKYQTVGKMGDVIEQGTLRPLEKKTEEQLNRMEPWQLREYMDMLKKRAHPDYIDMKNWQMQRNYLYGLLSTQGENSYTFKIVQEILAMSPKQFVAQYYKERDTSTFNFEYDTNIGDVPFRTQQIFNHYVKEDFDDFNPEDFDDDFGNNSNGEYDKVYDFLDSYNEWKANK